MDQRRFGLVKRKDQRLIGLDQVWEGFRLESDVAQPAFAYPKLSKTALRKSEKRGRILRYGTVGIPKREQ